MKNDISLRIKQAIENSGLTLLQLEKKTGISKSAIQRYTSGLTTKIPIDAVTEIAKATNTAPEYLLGWSSENLKPNQIVGSRLKLALQNSPLSISALSKRTGVPEEDLNKIISRKYTEMDHETISNIANELDVSEDYLMPSSFLKGNLRLQQTPRVVSEATILDSTINLLDYAGCDIALSTKEIRRIAEITKALHQALIKDIKENSNVRTYGDE